MTVAQLVHSMHGVARQSDRPLFAAPRCAASRPWSNNAVLWRAIGTGLAFALIGLAMMALALGAVGITPAGPQAGDNATAAAHALPNHHPGAYPDPTGPVTEAVPVP